jgi:hypothetical protein
MSCAYTRAPWRSRTTVGPTLGAGNLRSIGLCEPSRAVRARPVTGPMFRSGLPGVLQQASWKTCPRRRWRQARRRFMPCPARVSNTAPPRHIAVAVMSPAAAAEHRPAIVDRAAARAGGAPVGQAWPYGPPPRDTDSADEHDPEKLPKAPGADTDTLGTRISATAGTTATTARTTPASRNHRPAGAHRDSIPSRPRSRSTTATTMNAGNARGASKTHAASHPQPERPRAALSARIRPPTATRNQPGLQTRPTLATSPAGTRL